MPIQTLEFHVPFTPSNAGTVDTAARVIRNVAVITGNLTAEGHALVVDSKTVNQLFACANESGQVPVNLDHGTGIKDTCGWLENFHVAGNKLRGDWHLLETHDETPRMLERAKRMPGCFGLSVKFKGKGETKGLKKFARCEKLISVDCVTQPAANPDGLFSVPVDRAGNGMRKATQPTGEPVTLEDIAELLTQQTAQIAESNARVEAIEQHINSGGDDPEAEGEQLTDAQIDALVAQGALINDGQGNLVWADGDAGAGEGEGEGQLAGAGVGSEGEGAAMSAIQEINAFRAQLRTAQANQAAGEEQHAFAMLDERLEMLAAQNAELLEFNEQLEAQVGALQRTLRLTGGGKPSASARTNLFSAGEGADEESFESIVTAKYVELKAEGKLNDLQCRSQATDFGVRQNREAYAEYRERGGTISFSAPGSAPARRRR